MATMRKTEDHHHSFEQVEEYVATALRLAIKAKLTDDERRELLPTLVTLLASKQVFYEQAAPMQALDLNALRGRH